MSIVSNYIEMGIDKGRYHKTLDEAMINAFFDCENNTTYVYKIIDKINNCINEKDDVWKLFMNHEQQSIQHAQDINEHLNEFRTLLTNIEKRYNNKISYEKLEFLLNEKTTLTQSDIRDIIENVKSNE